MAEELDLAKAAGDFEMSPEEAQKHEEAVRLYNEKKAAKLAAKGGVVAAPTSQLVISFVMTNLIRQKGDVPIPEELQQKVDDALVAYVRKNVTERKRFQRLNWAEGFAVTPMFGGALRSITLSGKMLNEYSSEDFFDADQYKSWKRNPTGEPQEEDEDEDDYDDEDEEEEEEEEEDEDEDATPEQIAAQYVAKTDAALAKFAEFVAENEAAIKEADAAADANPGVAYYNFLHIPKVTTAKLDRMSND